MKVVWQFRLYFSISDFKDPFFWIHKVKLTACVMSYPCSLLFTVIKGHQACIEVGVSLWSGIVKRFRCSRSKQEHSAELLPQRWDSSLTAESTHTPIGVCVHSCLILPGSFPSTQHTLSQPFTVRLPLEFTWDDWDSETPPSTHTDTFCPDFCLTCSSLLIGHTLLVCILFCPPLFHQPQSLFLDMYHIFFFFIFPNTA